MAIQKVNIYLDQNMNKKLCDMQKKFHVSKSTIVDSLYIYFGELIPKIREKYLFDYKLIKTTKTSIKPKLDMWKTDLNRDKNMILTNLIYILVYDKFNEYTTQERYNHLKKCFYGHLQKVRESFYNYNEQLRNNVRMMKDESFRNYLRKYEKNDRKFKTESSRN